MYIDSNIFIYAATDKGKTGKECRKIIKLVNSDVISLIASFMVIDEVIWVLKKMVGKKDALKISKAMLLMPIKWKNIHRSIISSMLDIFDKTNLDPRDALHVSSMKEFGISTIVSEDEDFDKVKGIDRLSASGFVKKFVTT